MTWNRGFMEIQKHERTTLGFVQVRHDGSTISSGNSIVLRFGAARIKPGLSS
jgi:hypothetical protein